MILSQDDCPVGWYLNAFDASKQYGYVSGSLQISREIIDQVISEGCLNNRLFYSWKQLRCAGTETNLKDCPKGNTMPTSAYSTPQCSLSNGTIFPARYRGWLRGSTSSTSITTSTCTGYIKEICCTNVIANPYVSENIMLIHSTFPNWPYTTPQTICGMPVVVDMSIQWTKDPSVSYAQPVCGEGFADNAAYPHNPATLCRALTHRGCSLCPAGTQSNRVKPFSISYCYLCPKGKYSTGLGMTSLENCTTCEVGKYSTASGATYCNLCSAGRYWEAAGDGTQGQCCCPACGPGYYQPSQGQTYCIACIAGKWWDQYAGTYDGCVGCFPGKASATVGGGSEAVCTSCAIGKHACCHSMTECVNCGAGSYNTQTGRAGCISCEVGKYHQPTDVGTSSCRWCEAGKYTESTGVNTGSCTFCPSGTYNTGSGSSLRANCVDCAAGKYASGSGMISNPCQNCVAGQYSLSGASICIECQIGKYNTGTSQSLCLSCIAGKYQSAVGFTLCSDCGAGKYSTTQGATASLTCLNCPVGSSSTIIGNGALSNCQYCPAGQYYDSTT